ncbi:hypothetical protein LCGC14_2555170, partial [marine sediment metagenome]
MAKKSKQVNNKEKEEKLTINNISAGDVITDSTRNSKEWNVDDDLIEQMRRYEQESNKTAIWKNKITGMFLFFKYYEDNPEEKKKAKKRGRKPKKVEEEEELTDEEELEDIIEMGMTFCNYIDPFKLRTIFRFLYFTGLRRMEYINLARKDFDFEKQTVYVRGKTKSRTERELPLTKKVAKDVRSYFNTEPEIKNAFNMSSSQMAWLLKDIQDFVPKGKRLTAHTFR